MPLKTLIAGFGKAIDADEAKAHVVFAAQGTLVGVTEVDIRTGKHTFKVDESRSLGGGNVAANPVQYALASLGSCQAITYGSSPPSLASNSTRSPYGPKATWTSAAASGSTTGCGRASPRSASR